MLHQITRTRRLAILAIMMIASASFTSGSLVAAQDATPAAHSTTSTVTVQGSGSVRVAPDAATATVGIQVFEATLSGALATANAGVEAIIAAVKSAGVADADIQTNGLFVSVMQNYDERGNPLEVSGYQVSNQVSVVVRPPDGLGAVLDAAVSAGANTIYGVGFIVENPGEAANEARRIAVADARARAEVFAEAAGMSVGNVLSISESFGESTPGAEVAYADGKGGGGGIPVVSGSAAVTSSIQVTFEMI